MKSLLNSSRQILESTISSKDQLHKEIGVIHNDAALPLAEASEEKLIASLSWYTNESSKSYLDEDSRLDYSGKISLIESELVLREAQDTTINLQGKTVKLKDLDQKTLEDLHKKHWEKLKSLKKMGELDINSKALALAAAIEVEVDRRADRKANPSMLDSILKKLGLKKNESIEEAVVKPKKLAKNVSVGDKIFVYVDGSSKKVTKKTANRNNYFAFEFDNGSTSTVHATHEFMMAEDLDEAVDRGPLHNRNGSLDTATDKELADSKKWYLDIIGHIKVGEWKGKEISPRNKRYKKNLDAIKAEIAKRSKNESKEDLDESEEEVDSIMKMYRDIDDKHFWASVKRDTSLYKKIKTLLSTVKKSKNESTEDLDEESIDYSKKTDRELRAIRTNNAPDSTAWLRDKEKAQKYHRAAYAEQKKKEKTSFSKE